MPTVGSSALHRGLRGDSRGQPMAARPRHRRRHHRASAPSPSTTTAAPVRLLATGSSRSTSPGPGGSSTTRRDLGGGAGHRSAELVGRAGDRPVAAVGHHQPAGDGGGLGPPHRPARCTGPSCGRTAARPTAATRCGRPGTCPRPRAHRPRARPLLLGHQAGVAARPRAASTPTPDLAFGTVDTWLVWNLTGGDGGASPPTRPTPAARCSTTSGAWRGPTSCATCSACPLGALPEVRPVDGPARRRPPAPGRRPDGIPLSAASPATSRRPCSARPASPRASPRTPTAPARSCS